MKRQLSILNYALGALMRRRARSFALIAGLALVTGLYASGIFLTDALRDEVRIALDASPDLTLQRLVAGRPALIDQAAAESLAEDPGVASVTPRVWGFLYVSALEANVVVVADDSLHRDDSSEDGPAISEARIGSVLAGRLALRQGDRLSLGGAQGQQALEISEVRPTGSALHDADALFVPAATARDLLGVASDAAVDIAIELVRTDEAAVVGERLAEVVPGARVIDRRAMQRAYELTFDGRGGLMNALLLPCLAALLLLAWERVASLGVEERREIGILKSVGWLSRDVLAARLFESSIIALFGVGIGLILSYFFVFWLHAPGLSGVIFGWSVLHAELELVPASDLGALLALAALVIVPYVGLSLVPAWRAASMNVDQAQR